jgi:hypothetical protein
MLYFKIAVLTVQTGFVVSGALDNSWDGYQQKSNNASLTPPGYMSI